jgi:selenide, water dikinase
MSAKIAGGHTARGENVALGITANGFAKPGRLLGKRIAEKNQALILTKALGTGVLFAAEMQKKSKAAWLDAAIESQLRSNQRAAEILREFNVRACTDVTGFGLAGHLLEMLKSTSLQAVLDVSKIQFLEGALQCSEKNIRSSLFTDNFLFSQHIENFVSTTATDLLFDPQTSGGLLAALPEDRAQACVLALRDAGDAAAAQIGIMVEKISDEQKAVRLR